MLPTVTLHAPRLGTENGCAGGRKRQEQRVQGGPGSRRGWWEPFLCTIFRTQINSIVLAKGGCSLQGAVSLGPGAHPCRGEARAPHPGPSERSATHALEDPCPTVSVTS